jgi:hypothetical protein
VRSWACAWAAAAFAVAAGAVAGYERVVTWTWEDVARIGPWVLLGVALANILRSTLPAGVLAGPALLSAGALAAFAARDQLWTGLTTPQVVAGLLLVAAWGLLRLSSPVSTPTVALLWVTRRRLRVAPSRVVVVAVFGVGSVNLSDIMGPPPKKIVCIVVGGRVEVRVPANWYVTAASPVRVWRVQVADEGPRDADVGPSSGGPLPSSALSAPVITVRLLGVVGAVGLTRVRV